MTGAAAEAARARLDAAVTGAALEARSFEQFVAVALHTLMAPPALDLNALAAAAPGADWAGLATGCHEADEVEEGDPRECRFTDWAADAAQFERHVLGAEILIYSNPAGQGMTSGSLELRTFVAPDERGYLYWVGDGELTGGEMWFGYQRGDTAALRRELCELLPGYGGFGGAVVLSYLPDVEPFAQRLAETQGTAPWHQDRFDWLDPDDSDALIEDVIREAGVGEEEARQAVTDLVRGEAPNPELAWSIVHLLNGPPPRRVDDLYDGAQPRWIWWPLV